MESCLYRMIITRLLPFSDSLFSEAMMGAAMSVALIASNALLSTAPMRRNVLAMVPSEMLSPNSSWVGFVHRAGYP